MKQKIQRWAAAFLAFMSLITGITACQTGGDQTAENQDRQSGYQIYYLNTDETAIYPADYEPEGEDTQDLIEEFLEQLSENPEDTALTATLPQEVAVTSYELAEGVLSLHFDTAYQNMSKLREILCRAAIVSTLCQLQEVEYVSILIGDNPLLDSNETPIGPMNESSFVENPGSILDVTVNTVTLYFANESGDRLVEETVNIRSSSNISVERLVMEQLIRGPLTEEVFPTIPSETKLLGISTKDGICYVNLDNGFLDQTYDVTEAVPIYSIVNSLTALSGVTRVQILINGETNLVYRENIRFDSIFERNLDIIEESTGEE